MKLSDLISTPIRLPVDEEEQTMYATLHDTEEDDG
jgi:hypothetical protein